MWEKIMNSIQVVDTGQGRPTLFRETTTPPTEHLSENRLKSGDCWRTAGYPWWWWMWTLVRASFSGFLWHLTGHGHSGVKRNSVSSSHRRLSTLWFPGSRKAAVWANYCFDLYKVSLNGLSSNDSSWFSMAQII
jgi:hypothetical protein